MSASAVELVRPPSVVLVTDPRYPLERVADVVARAAAALASAGRPPLLVQLRDKLASSEALAATARALRDVTARSGALFVVNVSSSVGLAVAREAAADGVHVPAELVELARAELGGGAWVSTPAHTDEDVSFAARARATAVLVSPIWQTPGKGPPRGVVALTRARERASASGSRRDQPWVYALGGVDASRAAACAGAGAHGVAVIRALLDAADAGAVARLLDAPFQEPKQSSAPVARPGGRV